MSCEGGVMSVSKVTSGAVYWESAPYEIERPITAILSNTGRDKYDDCAEERLGGFNINKVAATDVD